MAGAAEDERGEIPPASGPHDEERGLDVLAIGDQRIRRIPFEVDPSDLDLRLIEQWIDLGPHRRSLQLRHLGHVERDLCVHVWGVEDVDDMEGSPTQARLLEGALDHNERMTRTVDSSYKHHLSPTFDHILQQGQAPGPR
jgi:hypothetical protein